MDGLFKQKKDKENLLPEILTTQRSKIFVEDLFLSTNKYYKYYNYKSKTALKEVIQMP